MSEPVIHVRRVLLAWNNTSVAQELYESLSSTETPGALFLILFRLFAHQAKTERSTSVYRVSKCMLAPVLQLLIYKSLTGPDGPAAAALRARASRLSAQQHCVTAATETPICPLIMQMKGAVGTHCQTPMLPSWRPGVLYCMYNTWVKHQISMWTGR